MKNLKLISTFILATVLAASPLSAFTQDVSHSYAYISIDGKLFSRKLKVVVDLGDTPEQIREAEEYSEKLTNIKSYAAVLNYMVEKQFELVEVLDYSQNFQGTGGTSGIVFIMRKKK
jgi:hypothetical protein